MKILYGIGNRPGASIQFLRFLEHADKFSVRVAAYSGAANSLTHIDWTLDPFIKKFRKRNQTNFNETFLLEDIGQWAPDLIISDGEENVLRAGQVLEIPTISCSPIHLYDGIIWHGQLKRHLFSQWQNIKADIKLICSPFGNFDSGLKIKEDYFWIRPYWKHTNEFKIINGETSYLSDMLFSGQKIISYFLINDMESILNCFISEMLNIGINLGNRANIIEEHVKNKLDDKQTMRRIEYFLDTLYLHEFLERQYGSQHRSTT